MVQAFEFSELTLKCERGCCTAKKPETSLSWHYKCETKVGKQGEFQQLLWQRVNSISRFAKNLLISRVYLLVKQIM